MQEGSCSFVDEEAEPLSRCGDTIIAEHRGLHLGRMQVTRDADRVARSVALSVCAYLLLVRLYGRDEGSGQPWSLFRLKQRFHADLMREEIDRTEREWQRKLKQYEDAA